VLRELVVGREEIAVAMAVMMGEDIDWCCSIDIYIMGGCMVV